MMMEAKLFGRRRSVVSLFLFALYLQRVAFDSIEHLAIRNTME
jgi:hypothetical protein